MLVDAFYGGFSCPMRRDGFEVHAVQAEVTSCRHRTLYVRLGFFPLTMMAMASPMLAFC